MAKSSLKHLYPDPHARLTIAHVKTLGGAICSLAADDPLLYRTERDFRAFVRAFLSGVVPASRFEWKKSKRTKGSFDFRTGGNNASLLELAVAPRRIGDLSLKQAFPGHAKTTQLSASQNRPEIRKLGKIPHSEAKMRFLLLVDLRHARNPPDRASFVAVAKKIKPKNPIRVVWVGWGSPPVDFRVGGK